MYTADQASRGERVFRGSCSGCHSTSEWRHESFLRSWSGRPVAELFDRLYETMPPRGPLPLHEYADVIAYFFHLNNLPSGGVELGTEDAALRAITIQPAAP